MQEENYIVREPLLNSQERVLGYELSWQRAAGASNRLSEDDALALASFVAEQMVEAGRETDSLLGDYIVFLEATPALLAHEAFCALPPKSTVFSLRGEDLSDSGALPAIRDARARGYGIVLRDVNMATIDRAFLSRSTHVALAFSAADFDRQVLQYRSLNLQSLELLMRDVADWETYDSCASEGLSAFVGKLHLTPRPGNFAKGLNPAQTMILELMDMVKQNADVRQLESLLKRDAALSYKLLRYINSAGFGLGCEIQSLKHAVTMLGYSPLYRWLALLLATSSTTGYSPILMQTAVIRGRFSELLGQAFLPRQDAENLFVAGMFSLLDKLLGVPMEDVLEKVQLPEPVTQALLSREGIYGPFLQLAEACELNAANVGAMAASLCISAQKVSQAHLSALAWTQRLKL